MDSNTTTVPLNYQINYFGYDPNEPLAYFGAALFGVMFFIVLGLNYKFKSWFFIVIPIASAMEVVGFAMRPFSTDILGKYIVSVLCILLAPTVFAMADYTLIGRIMKKTGIEHPIFRPNVVRYIFLAADILSFFIQAGGGGLTASKDLNTSKNGSRMLLVGLCISLSIFVFFLFLTTYVHLRLRKNENQKRERWTIIFYLLYFDMILFIIRSSYRVAEYAKLEYHNPISTNETYFYTLDGLEMALLNLLWIPFHPGFWDMLDTNNDDETEMQ